MGHDDLHRGIAFHDRKANQSRGNEHMVVEPIGQNRRQRMAERRGAGEDGGSGRAAAAAGKRPAAPTGERRLYEPILDFLEERPVRCPLRVPQARGVACTAAVIPSRSSSAQSGL